MPLGDFLYTPGVYTSPGLEDAWSHVKGPAHLLESYKKIEREGRVGAANRLESSVDSGLGSPIGDSDPSTKVAGVLFGYRRPLIPFRFSL
ncbi:hypothetical protein CRG98_028278 [Punica granatum]|uniref:Uncharacterized protein n=1 Tax=Punica granatum TaxID=22663 RepID=A0A2I0J526_PUNGR|nr:hypothetical protein CRG98_028278 [Punica granatum]